MKLSDLKQNFDFNPPEGYFDNFEDRIFEKIEKENKSQKNKISKVIKMLSTAVAASFIALGLYVYSSDFKKTETKENENQYDYTQYLVDNCDDYTFYEFTLGNKEPLITYTATDFIDYGTYFDYDLIIEEY
ncbi:MAG: hypothetical protein MJ211_05030 [Bacteroidales bacterium]|nr:hypothetical protein [Bacteroidales bacterium]